MAIAKHEIPILEYDDSQKSVIMPDHEGLARLPEKAVLAFLGDCIDEYARENGCAVVSRFVSTTKRYPVYLTRIDGEEVCLCQAPAGAAAAVQIIDWLIGYGVKKIISAGSCGVLADMPENAFIVPVRALRDEGASYHYLPPSRFVELNRAAIKTIECVMCREGLPYTKCITWSTDGFFRETADMIAYRKQEGCAVVEMECAALAACAQFRGVQFGQFFYTADSLANAEKYDARGFGAASTRIALELCLKIIAEM